jgi:hypothetical protein
MSVEHISVAMLHNFHGQQFHGGTTIYTMRTVHQSEDMQFISLCFSGGKDKTGCTEKKELNVEPRNA